jgi:alcohol dehydrogenase
VSVSASVRTVAAVLDAQGLARPYADSRPLTVETLELEAPGPGEVLLEIRAAGLCHSDLSGIEGVRPRPVPVVLGHESAGVVHAVGEGVRDLAQGQHVVTSFVSPCGECAACSDGRPNLCSSHWEARSTGALLTGGRRLRRASGELVNHGSGLSAFSQYSVVSRHAVVPVATDVPFEDAALFGCAVMTGVGAVVNTARVPPGATVAVVGLGGVGLSALLGAALSGAGRLLALDLSPAKLGLARQLGATETFEAGAPECVEQVLESVPGGVDYAFEMAGSIAAMTLAYRITRRGGTTVSAGLPHHQETVAIPLAAMVSDERTIKGSYMGSCSPRRDIPRFIDLYRKGKLPVDRLRSGSVTFDEINEGFDRLADGEVVRQILLPHA